MTIPATQTGAVVSVNVSEEKGTVKQPVPEGVVAEHGIEGDAHAGDWHRQVSLLATESIERFSREAGREIAPGEFAENVTTRGVDFLGIGVFDRIAIGAVSLEVTQLGKVCHGDACAIFREVGQCVMPKEGIFCRVLSGGAIRPGDEVVHTARPLRIEVITLSDRASRGVYEDRSGPRVVERLEEFFGQTRWHLEVERNVLPDDAATLRAELEAARDAGVDAVITTGGTGVGPRDVTPDVVAALADKLIPGIMEHIRVKYGADKPNALLSRSIAAILGGTVVYTLPGSVKAVDEYMGEILRTLEHVLVMVHGLDTH